jgi:hypothetical protein
MTKRPTGVAFASVFLLSLAHAQVVLGDPIRLASGSINTDWRFESGLSLIVPERRLEAATVIPSGEVLPRTLCQPCSAGQRVRLDGSFIPVPEAGILGGFAYVDGEFRWITAVSSFQVNAGTISVPTVGGPLPDFFELTSPFSMSGHIRIIDDLTRHLILDSTVVGMGTAHLVLANRLLGLGDSVESVSAVTHD